MIPYQVLKNYIRPSKSQVPQGIHDPTHGFLMIIGVHLQCVQLVFPFLYSLTIENVTFNVK